jgi:beta-glucosidase
LAATFDLELIEQLAGALSLEARAKRIAIIMGPTVNIARSPLCGRGFEFFGEDPYLSGKLGARHVKTLQKNGIIACLKHFVSGTARKTSDRNPGRQRTRI